MGPYMIKKLLCKLPRFLGGGHRRGIPVESAVDTALGKQAYRCPRCGRVKARKAKANKGKAT